MLLLLYYFNINYKCLAREEDYQTLLKELLKELSLLHQPRKLNSPLLINRDEEDPLKMSYKVIHLLLIVAMINNMKLKVLRDIASLRKEIRLNFSLNGRATVMMITPGNLLTFLPMMPQNWLKPTSLRCSIGTMLPRIQLNFLQPAMKRRKKMAVKNFP